MTPPNPLQDRIRELESSARMADALGDLLFAKTLRQRALELEEELKERNRERPS